MVNVLRFTLYSGNLDKKFTEYYEKTPSILFGDGIWHSHPCLLYLALSLGR